MAALHAKVTDRLRFLKASYKSRICAEKLMELTEDTTTAILHMVSSYPYAVPIDDEIRNALVKSICEHSDLFTFEDTEAMVLRISELRNYQHDTVDDRAATSKRQKATPL